MVNEKWVWFDMDGTIADFYGVEGWLADLEKKSTRPYEVADLLYDIEDMVNALVELKLNGYNVGIVSWSSKAHDTDFDKRVKLAKQKWLEKNCIDLFFDEFIVAPYGTCKADICRPYGNGILVDDEEPNRNAWDLGSTINANENIIELLKAMLDK